MRQRDGETAALPRAGVDFDVVVKGQAPARWFTLSVLYVLVGLGSLLTLGYQALTLWRIRRERGRRLSGFAGC